MATSIGARHAGENLQALLFFIEACKLLQDYECVKEVGFEVRDAPGFDDISVTYTKPIPDDCGGLTALDFVQVKFHVYDNKLVTSDDIIDPIFIGATSESLLKKTIRLQQKYAPQGTGCRIILRQPCRIDPDDPLIDLVDQRAGTLKLAVLFKGGDRSRMGRLRKKWREHLGVDDNVLRLALMPLRMPINTEALIDVKSRLNNCLQNVGLKPVDATQSFNPYEQLGWKLASAKGEVKLDKDGLIQLMKEQNLYCGPPLNTLPIRRLGLKSFSKYSNQTKRKTDNHYSCVDLFNNRQIRDPDNWNSQIYPELISFFESEIHPGDNICLYLDCHYSIVYAAGHESAISGVKVWPEQFGIPWIVSDNPVRLFDTLWRITNHRYQKGEDIAVAVSVSQTIREDVMRAIKNLDLPIGLLVEANVLPKVSRQAVVGADHAYLLAQDLMQHLQKMSAINARRGCIHLFVSIPKALMFFMGQEGRTLPRVQLYEYEGDYTPSILIE